MSLSASSTEIATATTSLYSASYSNYNYDSIFGTSTTSSIPASSTAADDYPVFPNGAFVSKFLMVSARDSGLTHLDIDLYNYCYLPYNPLPYFGLSKRSPQYTGEPRPDYQLDSAPCKRAAAINANCYLDNTNGSFSGLRPSEQPEVQKQCYCELYPYFDSTLGCMQCFKQHGGIEGYHWFPKTYVEAISSSYCAASPQSTGFYQFASQWASTDPAASVPSTTAENVLGSQTAASLYYTYAAAVTTGSSKNPSSRLPEQSFPLRFALLAMLSLIVTFVYS